MQEGNLFIWFILHSLQKTSYLYSQLHAPFYRHSDIVPKDQCNLFNEVGDLFINSIAHMNSKNILFMTMFRFSA